MITDCQANTVYFAEDTKEEFPEEFLQLEDIIKSEGYGVDVLEGTNDFYCRDYMPVQLTEKDFVQFVFRPDKFLEENALKYESNPVQIALLNQLPTPRHSKIILDGGNIVKWKDKVIITDRVYKDNIHQFSGKDELLKELEVTLQCNVIIVPEYPNEETGHADSLIRFIDGNRVFINETGKEPHTDWLEGFLKIIEINNLDFIELPCPVFGEHEDAKGLYINFLNIGNAILVPQFEIEQDEKALQVFKHVFSDKKRIIPYPSSWIAKYGGVLNCLSWNVIK